MGLPFENADYDEDRIGATKVTELTDTSISNLVDNNILVYNSTTEKWENQAPSSTSVNDINDIGNVNITSVQDGQRLVYNSSTSKWENATITDNNTDNLTDLTDTNLLSIGNNETLIYNTNVGKWENGNINLNYIGDVNISSVSNGEVLKYNSTTSKWENKDNTDNLNELTDVTITSSQNNHVLKYNSTAGVYKNAFVNLTELADTNITSLADKNVLMYNSTSTIWQSSPFNINDNADVNITSLANNQLLKYNSTASKWENFSPTYLTQETDPFFNQSPVSSITNGTGFLKNDGNGTWSYDNNAYLTSVGIHQIGGLTYTDVSPDEIIRKSSNTTAEGAGLTIRDTYSATTPVFTYKKTMSYFGRFGAQVQPFGVNQYTTNIDGYNQLLHPNSAYLGGGGGFYIHSTGGEASNIRVGINIQLPEETLEVDGSIQIDSANVGRLKFQKSGQNAYALAEIDAEADGAGGQLEFYTSAAGTGVSKRLTINNKGALGLGTTPDYGTPNYFLKTLGETNSATWSAINLDTLNDVTINLAPGATTPVNGEFLAYRANTNKWENTSVLNSISTTSFFNINSPLQLQGSNGNPGQHLKSNGNAAPTWTNELNANSISTTSNNNLIIQTNPTTQAVEFRTSQIYPQTNNTTRLGGAGNRWLEGYFDITDTNLIKTQGVYNIYGNVEIGPLNYAYPRFRIGGQNGWNEAYLSNTMNSGYYFRIAGHPAYQGAMHFHANGNITCNTSFTPASDDRLKHNETNITKALHLIRQLVPKKYEKTETMLPADYKGTLPKGMNYVIEAGFIAQEIKKIPELSFAVNGGDYENEKEDGTKEIKAHPFNLNYDTIFTYVTAAVKELDTIVQKQAELISSLEARIKTLESK